MLNDDEIRGRAVDAFGDWALARVEDEAVLAAVTHEPTRRLLADVGLPLQGPYFSLDTDFLTTPTTFPEHVADGYYEPGGPGQPHRQVMVGDAALAAWGRLLLIGDSGAGESFFLDPGSGAVYAFFLGWDNPPCLVNSTLSDYLAALALVEKGRFIDGVPLEELDDSEPAYERLEAMVEQLRQADPPAFDACEHGAPWGGWLDDPLAWGGLDWEWEEPAMAYFEARGIDPSEREPRRSVHKNEWEED